MRSRLGRVLTKRIGSRTCRAFEADARTTHQQQTVYTFPSPPPDTSDLLSELEEFYSYVEVPQVLDHKDSFIDSWPHQSGESVARYLCLIIEESAVNASEGPVELMAYLSLSSSAPNIEQSSSTPPRTSSSIISNSCSKDSRASTPRSVSPTLVTYSTSHKVSSRSSLLSDHFCSFIPLALTR